MRSHSYLNTAKQILKLYGGNIPFAAWLKDFFRADKKYGSKDRKHISDLCYGYFRLGNAFRELETNERLLTGLFLTSHHPGIIIDELKKEWSEKINESIDDKIVFLEGGEEVGHLFPIQEAVSVQIELYDFNKSFLLQPDLFLRIRPGKKDKVIKHLEEENIIYQLMQDDCLRLPNNTPVNKILDIDSDVAVQDYNSQQVIKLLQKVLNAGQSLDAWDCCAASGGKSILLHDLFKNVHLTVSDIRRSILLNLQNRFKRASITGYTSFIGDIASEKFSLQKTFDLVICDAPCSGSGTWSRTPELLSFFKKEKIRDYASLQKRIARNASRAVKSRGFLLYSTCSVFREENEEVVLFIQQNSSLQLLSADYYKGYDQKADTLFAALFKA